MASSSLLLSPDGSDNVRVCVRVRPINEREKNEQKILVANPAQRSILFDARPESKLFNFDFVADEHSTQEQMWLQVGKPVVDTCIAGYNGTIFAYGQTGSGKTFTIQGGVRENGQLIPELRGLVPRSFEYLFKAIQREQQTSGGRVAFLCKCSYLEIFQEQICDLLNPTAQTLNIREDAKNGVYVEGLTEEVVRTPDEAYALLLLGARHRHTSPTAMNERSSRSHSVFTLSIESTETKNDVTSRRFSKLSLVDLAGSERQKSTEAAGQRLKEAGSINKSLFLLGNVIRDLVDVANGKPKHIPYRNSRLTFLLRDSLGGNSKTTIVATISSAADSFSETLSTLKFAARAKLIRNQAVINQDLSVSVPELKMELQRLKEELSVWQARAAGAPRRGMAETKAPQEEPRVADTRVRDLETLLMTALDRAQLAEEEQARIQRELTELKTVNEKKDAFVQNAKLLVKLRDNELATLRGRKSPKEAHDAQSEREKALEAEVKALRAQLDAAPAQSEQALQFLEMRNRIRFLESQFAPEIALHTREVPRMQRFINELTAALHECVNEKNTLAAKSQHGKSPMRSFAANAASPARRMVREQMEELQGDLAATREELTQVREMYTKLEAENIELQTLVLEQEQKLGAEQDARQREADALKEIFEANVSLLKEAYRKELLEPTARTEEAITSLLAERSQLQTTVQQQRHKIKELEFTLSTKHTAPAVRKITGPRRLSLTDEPEEATSAPAAATDATGAARANAPPPSLAIAALEKKLQTREAALEQAQRELSGVRDDFETLQAEFRFREQTLHQQSDALRKATEGAAELEAKLASAEERAASVEEMLRRQTEALEAAKHSGESSAQLMLESVEDNTRLRREVQVMQEEIERTAEALREAKAAKEALQAETARAADENERLKRYVEERDEFCEKLCDAVRRHEEEEKKLRAELADSRLEAEAASRTGQAIAGELEHAREEAEELKAFHESEAAELTRQATLLKEELARKTEEWAQQEAKLRDDGAMLADSLKLQVEELASERAEAAAAAAASDAARLAWQNERAALIAECEAAVSRVEAEKIALMKESRSSTEKFSNEIRRLENEAIKKLQDRLAEQTAKTAATAEALDALGARFAAAEKETQQLQSALAAKEASIREAEARVALLTESLQTTEAEVRARVANEAQLEERITALHTQAAAQVRQAEATAASLTAEADKLRGEIARIASEREADKEQMKQLKEAEVRAFDESLTWKNRTEQLQEEKLAVEKAKEQLAASFAELETQNANLVSHSNTKQKIHLHVQIKEENNALRHQQAVLIAKVQKRDALLKKLDAELRKFKKPEEMQLLDEAENIPADAASAPPKGKVAPAVVPLSGPSRVPQPAAAEKKKDALAVRK